MGKFKVLVPDPTTNYILNPSLENDADGWTLAGSVIARSYERSRYGRYSLEVDTTGGVLYEGTYYRVSGLSGDPGPFTASAYVRGSGKVRIRIKDGLTGQETASKPITLNDEYWQRISVTGRGSGSDDLRLYVETTERIQDVTFYVDGAQIEQKGYLTTYCDGSQKGCRWNGKHNASTSQREAAEMSGGYWQYISDPECEVYHTVVGGAGMPPISNNYQVTAITPGGVFDNTKINERILNILIWATDPGAQRRDNISLKVLHSIRQSLIDLVKPDQSAVNDPFILGYEETGRTLTIPVRYESGLEFDGDMRNKWSNTIPLRMLALDPFWYEDSQDVTVLDTENADVEFTGTIGRLDGQWQRIAQGLTPTVNVGVVSMAETADGVVYAGGNFTTDGDGVALRRLARLNDDLSAWEEVVSGLNGLVLVVRAHPNGKIYIGGVFTADNNGNPYSRIVEYDPDTDTFAALGAGAADGTVYDIAIGPNGDVYAVGDFSSMTGFANTDSIARWDLDGTWHDVGGGFDTGANDILAVEVVASDEVYIGGSFNTAAGEAADYIALWNGTAWAELGGGTNALVSAIKQSPTDKNIYITGLFTTANGEAANRAMIWNGSAFSALGDGLDGAQATSSYNSATGFDEDGNFYVTGLDISSAGDVTTISEVAVWNGTSWHNIDLEIDTDWNLHCILITRQNDIFLGAPVILTTEASGLTVVNCRGTVFCQPVIEFWGNGRIIWLENQSSQQKVYLDYTLQDAEILTLDFRTGERRASSNYRGDVPSAILPNSDNIALIPGNQEEEFANQVNCLVIDEVSPVVQLRYIPRHHAFDAIEV